MQQATIGPELLNEYDFRAEGIAEAKVMARAAGFPPNASLLALCDRFVLGEIPLYDFRREIVCPFLHRYVFQKTNQREEQASHLDACDASNFPPRSQSTRSALRIVSGR